MNALRRSILFFSTALLPLASVRADFDTRIIAADAQWVVQADLNTLRETTLGRELITLAAKLQQEKKEMQSVQVDVQKLLTTVGTVTAYGSRFSKDADQIDGTLLLQGTPELRTLAEGYIAQATVSTPDKVTELKDLPFEAYSIDGQVTVAFPREPIILISKSKAQLTKALEVFRGQSASLAKASDSPLRAMLQGERNAYFRAASVVPTAEMFPDGAPQARILQMAKTAAIVLGEESGRTFAHVELAATSDEMADKLTKILQGITAMVSLAETNDKHLAEFLKSMKVERSKQTVTLNLAYGSDRMVELIKSSHDRAKAAPEKPKDDSVVIAEWVADQDLGDDGPAPNCFAERTIENVALVQGATLTLHGRRNEGENARFDVVEISIPDSGQKPLRFQAENMVLSQYQAESNAAASGGKVIILRGDRGHARFQFPAADGLYTIKVRYVDENDGKSTFSLRLKNPAADKADET